MHFSAALGYLDVRIVDTDYSSFAVVYIYKELEGALSTMVQLYSEAHRPRPRPRPPSPLGPAPSGPASSRPPPLPSQVTRSQVWAPRGSGGGGVGAALWMGSG